MAKQFVTETELAAEKVRAKFRRLLPVTHKARIDELEPGFCFYRADATHLYQVSRLDFVPGYTGSDLEIALRFKIPCVILSAGNVACFDGEEIVDVVGELRNLLTWHQFKL